MGGFQDWITRTFAPSVYWQAKSRELGGELVKTSSNADVIPVSAFESPRDPSRPTYKKSVTLAEALPERLNGRVFTPTWSTEEAISTGLDASVWAAACMSLLADALGQVHFRVDEWSAATERWTPAPCSPLQTLLDKPNDKITRQTFFQLMTYNLFLSGNALATVIRVQDVPVELWPQDVRYHKPIKSRVEFISGYQQKIPGATERTIKARDMLHFMFVDPADPYWGRSPMKAAMDTIQTDNAARDWNKVAMANRAVSDGVFTAPGALTAKQYDELRARIREQHQGVDAAREPWLLSNGTTWTPMDRTPVEMDFINSRKHGREEICAIYRVPPPMIGIYEKATLNNAFTGRRIFWEDTAEPLASALAAYMTMTIGAEFSKRTGARLRVVADTTSVPALWKAYTERLDAAVKARAMGYTLNEVNERFRLGFPEVEDTRGSSAPSSEPSSGGSGEDDPAEPDTDASAGAGGGVDEPDA